MRRYAWRQRWQGRVTLRTAAVLVAGLATFFLCSSLLTACGQPARPQALLPRPLPAGSPKDEFALRVLRGPEQATLVVAAVRIDGSGPYPFLLDSGAAVAAVNAPLARHLHLRVLYAAGPRLQGVGCSSPTSTVQVKHWRVGRVSLPVTDLATVALSSSKSLHGIDGLLGSNVLSHLSAVTVNYRKTRATVGARAMAKRGHVVPVKVLSAHGQVLVVAPVRFASSTPYPFVVDTGASESAVVPKLAGKFHFHVIKRSVPVTGVSCTTKASLVQLSHWAVGKVALPVRAAVSVSLPVPTGLLGSNVLSKFGSVTIDYARRQLVLS